MSSLFHNFSLLIDDDNQPPLINLEDFIYQGAFRTPTGTYGTAKFSFSSGRITYNPDNNSLFIAGGVPNPVGVAEISIPTLVDTLDINDMHFCDIIQPFNDIGNLISGFDVEKAKAGNGFYTGALTYDNGKLHVGFYDFYDGGRDNDKSHATCIDANILNGAWTSIKQVATHPNGSGVGGLYGYYACEIPNTKRHRFGGFKHAVGGAGLSITGRTSQGCAAHACDLNNLPGPYSPMVWYNLSNTLSRFFPQGIFWEERTYNTCFNGLSNIGGMSFLNGTDTLAFFGSHSTNEFCYGTGDCPIDYTKPVHDCCDPTSRYKGTHSVGGGHQPWVWLYNVADLVNVFNGVVEPYDIKPYEFGPLFPTTPWDITIRAAWSGVTYDKVNRRLFLVGYKQDNTTSIYHSGPIVHVFTH